MAAPVRLRSDFTADHLWALAKRSRDPDQTRRLLALAAIYDGASRTEAARIGCVTLQIVRDWVLRFNTNGPEGLVTGRAPGASPLLNNKLSMGTGISAIMGFQNSLDRRVRFCG